MSRIIWDQSGERHYETGVRQGVLYVMDKTGHYPLGVPWNGLTGVTESPSGAEPTPLYADDIKYLNLISAEEFGATIEAFTYPDEFMECDGSGVAAEGVYVGQQSRRPFGFSYRTVLGNDIELNEFGYKLHLIYGAIASPSEKAYATINDSPEAITFSWEVATTPTTMTGFSPTSSITIDSTKVDEVKLKAFEDILYGTNANGGTGEGTPPRLPLPDEVVSILGIPAAG